MNDDRTNESLLKRRELAEKATKGPWKQVQLSRSDSLGQAYWQMLMVKRDEYSIDCRTVAEVRTYMRGGDNAAHIAANSPEVVMADIDEILHLRAENARLEQEAEWLAVQLANGLMDHPCLIEHLHGLSNGLCHSPTPEMLLEAARKAVEEVELMEEDQ